MVWSPYVTKLINKRYELIANNAPLGQTLIERFLRSFESLPDYHMTIVMNDTCTINVL
jgi:hypothetical protein